MKILVVGAGVIGSVYGAHLAEGGATIALLGHGQRTNYVAEHGLIARDSLRGTQVRSPVPIVPNAGADVFDIVLVAVRREQLAATLGELQGLAGDPLVLLFGNNPAGRAVAPSPMASNVCLGFPGICGTMVDGVAEYVPIRSSQRHCRPAMIRV